MGKIKNNIIVDGTVLAEQSTDPKGLATNSQVDSKLNLKVDKISGKGLSTNDFTNDYIIKINAAESGYKGVIKSTDNTPTEAGQYTPVDDATYPNGLTYNKSTDGMTLFIFDGVDWIKVSNLASNGSSIALPWTAREYLKSERVLDDKGELYTAVENTEVSENTTSDVFKKNAFLQDNVYFLKKKYLT